MQHLKKMLIAALFAAAPVLFLTAPSHAGNYGGDGGGWNGGDGGGGYNHDWGGDNGGKDWGGNDHEYGGDHSWGGHDSGSNDCEPEETPPEETAGPPPPDHNVWEDAGACSCTYGWQQYLYAHPGATWTMNTCKNVVAPWMAVAHPEWTGNMCDKLMTDPLEGKQQWAGYAAFKAKQAAMSAVEATPISLPAPLPITPTKPTLVVVPPNPQINPRRVQMWPGITAFRQQQAAALPSSAPINIAPPLPHLRPQH